MKAFYVCTYNVPTVPLNGSNGPGGKQPKDFDTEEEAMKYAERVQREWDCVTVHRRVGDTEIARFQHGYKIVGKTKTRVEAGQ